MDPDPGGPNTFGSGTLLSDPLRGAFFGVSIICIAGYFTCRIMENIVQVLKRAGIRDGKKIQIRNPDQHLADILDPRSGGILCGTESTEFSSLYVALQV
jgi:hypothetical protein